ncbi:MAG TPA: hypothetical protein DEP05_06360 [Betaproteobacteria bacterium]|nr:hypothetical protein [Betaproteobacteria bacterium]
MFLAAVAIGAITLWNVRQPNPQLERINHALSLRADTHLLNYPYPFRVVRLNGAVAVMATPAVAPSAAVVAAITPSLRGKPAADPAVVRAEKTLTRMQQEARRIVLAQPQIRAVQWVADPAWLRRHGAAG